jgi:hypothetical protein
MIDMKEKSRKEAFAYYEGLRAALSDHTSIETLEEIEKKLEELLSI